MEDQREKLMGLVGTVSFHALIILFLLFVYLKTPTETRLSEWGGVPVMFGNVADAFGDDEPYGGGGNIVDGEIAIIEDEMVLPQEETMTTPPKQALGNEDESVATQDLDETVSISEAQRLADEKRQTEEMAEVKRKEKEKADAAEQKKVAEQKRIAEEQRVAALKAAEDKKKSDINNLMAGALGIGDKNGLGNRGDTEGEGIQGVSTGNASFGKKEGVGGWGKFDLGGRGTGKGGLIMPTYTENDYGVVVIDIVVNPQGLVVEATIGRGTNTTSSVLKQEAVKAAKKTRFAVVTTLGNQKGTITYNFDLN